MSLSHEIETKLNNISLLLVMVSSDDRTGLEAIEALLEQVHELIDGKEGFGIVLTSINEAKKLLAEKASGQDYIRYVESLIGATQRFIKDPAAKIQFPHEDPAVNNQDFEFAKHYDADFLSEFIEKHQLLLDELEMQATEIKYNKGKLSADDKAKFQKYVRSYLHNIKGDAGAIGLAGIEAVTHVFEDLLLNKDFEMMLGCISLYREWATNCIASYTKSRAPREHSSSFIERLRKSVEDAANPNKDHESTTDSDADRRGASNHPSEGHEIISGAVDASDSLNGPSSEEELSDEVNNEPLGEYDLSADSSLFAEFAAEADDHLKELERIMLQGVDDISDSDVDTVFRGVHSLKGASSFFNLLEINETSHILETILDRVRDGKRKLDERLVSIVLEYVDLQNKLLATAREAVEKSRPVVRYREAKLFHEKLLKVSAGETVADTPVEATTKQPQVKAIVEPKVVQEVSTQVAREKGAERKETAEEEQKGKTVAKKGENLELKTFIKIDTGRLDHLIDSIGEMVIYSSMLIRKCRELLGNNETIQQTTHQVEKFSRDLQEIGMSMRLDPIKGLFQKMARLVWDVSKRLGKDINFAMKGEDTELDRNVIEKLADPLMHMVRNAIDHGIEPPAERISKGKSPQGTIELQAYHAGGSIHIRIRDDGRGLDKQKLRAKAIEKGLISPDQVLSDSETFQLIFAPGFSTAAVVTDISGRGVGMDVVRNNIESMRGQVVIESELGKGSTFLIELPLTLAIIDGIEVAVGCERFIIPTLSIIELIRPDNSMVTSTVSEEDTFAFRGKFIPLYRLSKLYSIQSTKTKPAEAIIAVLESGNEQIALMVDNIVGSCQTVIKSLGGMFKEGKGLAGCAIMPNGDIGLILDVRSIIQLSRACYPFELKLGNLERQVDQFNWSGQNSSRLGDGHAMEQGV